MAPFDRRDVARGRRVAPPAESRREARAHGAAASSRTGSAPSRRTDRAGRWLVLASAFALAGRTLAEPATATVELARASGATRSEPARAWRSDALLRVELRSADPAVATAAASVLSERRLDAGDLQGALALLEAAPVAELDAEAEERFRSVLVRALVAAIGSAGDETTCVRVLATLGDSALWLAHRSRDRTLESRIRDCERRIGLRHERSDRVSQQVSARNPREIWPELAACERTLDRVREHLTASGFSPKK